MFQTYRVHGVLTIVGQQFYGCWIPTIAKEQGRLRELFYGHGAATLPRHVLHDAVVRMSIGTRGIFKSR